MTALRQWSEGRARPATSAEKAVEVADERRHLEI